MPAQIKNFTELDFDQIRENIKTYLQSQEKFKDYNFDGSAMAIMLDVLAYNTQYNAFYANMMASERFIATAQRRESVVNLARNLGYVPRSTTSAKATVRLTIVPDDAGYTDAITIPSGTLFTAKAPDNTSLTFKTRTSYVATKGVDDQYVIDVEITEGTEYVYSYEVKQDFEEVVIPNPNVDTTSLRVYVKDSVNAITENEYGLASDYTQIKESDLVYFLKETENEKFAVFFGDDHIGLGVRAGNYVRLTYDLSAADLANGISIFTLASEITTSVSGATTVTVETIDVASGGQEIESIDSIRKRAPAYYQRQNRAVTANDFKNLFEEKIFGVRSGTAWGGEVNDPPAYGIVFISMLPTAGTVVSDTLKESITKTFENTFSTLSIDIVPVDVIPTYLEINSVVTYDSTLPNLGIADIKSKVQSAIIAYTDENLNDFDKSLRFSRLLGTIDDADTAIVSNDTNIGVYQEYKDIAQFQSDPTFKFKQSLEKGTVQCNEFIYSIYPRATFVENQQTGKMDLVNIINANDYQVIHPEAASINYASGTISIDLLKFDPDLFIPQDRFFLKISAVTTDEDIRVKFNRVLIVRESDITVRVEDEVTGATL